ncbi:type II toxin-antitoxin system prevent-host-death family antitoxin [Leucothrix pacifica]|uniref:Antitoxin n=1 Tax=Leucothrix pacifica TaxID=1247513 RepID=A0A317CJB8_9GAMM|nr:type II toxin-antitoxin system prevent-host-death family antitoxin [Leucothrix pacifica]PWQ98586.1 hypothetical protein DKW60_07550 [Leucothrix pacifica]
MPNTQSEDAWTVAEAKAKLSELLRCADERPQYIGARKPYVLISVEQWEALTKPKESMGEWLVKNMANLGELELPDRKEPSREIPFQ